MAVLGDRWTFLILRDVLFGVHRYGELQRSLGMARSVLANRLRRLVDEGLLERVRYRTDPDWYEYRPSASALALYPALVALVQWSGEHFGDECAPVVLRHRECGEPTRLDLVCSRCGQRAGHGDLEAEGGGSTRVVRRG